MAKRNDDRLPVEDYIEQLQWRSSHHRRIWPVRYELKWKYKIVYRYPAVTPLDRGIRIAILAGMILSIVYIIASDRFTEQAGEKIFFGLVFGLIFAILFFAVREATDDKKDDS